MLKTTVPVMSADQVQPLLHKLSEWQNCTVIMLTGGCIFEFKGPFPKGSIGHGYYNLDSGGQGFEGHLQLDAIKKVRFQDQAHRGKESYAFVFEDRTGKVIFKVFVGRQADGELIPEQVATFKQIQANLFVS